MRQIGWRLRSTNFDIDVRYKKGIENCQTNALLRLRTNAEAGTSSTKLDIPSFEESDLDGLDFIESEFGAVDNPLDLQVANSKEPGFAQKDVSVIGSAALRLFWQAD